MRFHIYFHQGSLTPNRVVSLLLEREQTDRKTVTDATGHHSYSMRH